MPKASHVTMWRLLGVSAAAVALSAVAATSAYAGDCPGGDGWDKGHPSDYKPGTGAGVKTATDRCEFSLDGVAWKASVQVDDLNLKPSEDGKVHVKVRAAGDAESCTASLASYRTFGATWATSGEQVFHDFDTVNVKQSVTDTLDIAVPDVGCFAQVDLYRGSVKFDGKKDANDGFEHGDLPIGPSRPVIKDKLIASWNGGTKDCTTQTVPTPTPTPTKTPPGTTPDTTPTPTKTPLATTTPDATPSTTAPGAVSPTETESASPNASTSASASESASPVVSTSSSAQGGLAETGSGDVVATATGAAALLAVGGGVLFFMRRRGEARSH
ncbi:LPXTG cell wall anchor domain-containing protein [Streptomyces sp. NBC_01317]|uniref:LPXTG cell wall anchor domain-containing protein n=1 Tax=Streptomyces sp. NBC_01317 TaxID=2903822 RepID=UPI002E1336AD|nr:LPXTG cell wall anchor domain-containing protein [Streptomyces sp. NBC_01317]